MKNQPMINKEVIKIPLIEFDPVKEALIDPTRIKRNPKFPCKAILCYFNNAIRKLLEDYDHEKIEVLYTAMGEHPVYLVNYKDFPIIVMHPGIGAPLVVGMVEELVSLGCNKFINFGGAGVFDNTIPFGSLIVIESAIRDEGTSYHYQPPSRIINVDTDNLRDSIDIFKKNKINYLQGRCWSTDAFYRETKKKIQRRKDEGAICVDMECSALIALSKFRNVDFIPILMASDSLCQDKWLQRSCNNICDLQYRLFTICIDILKEW